MNQTNSRSKSNEFSTFQREQNQQRTMNQSDISNLKLSASSNNSSNKMEFEPSVSITASYTNQYSKSAICVKPTISNSSEHHAPHSPSASYSFSENNSSTHPSVYHYHHHKTTTTRPQSTPQKIVQLKSFQFDEHAFDVTANSTNMSPNQPQFVHSSSSNTNNITPLQTPQDVQNEKIQQLMPDASTTSMTPTPIPVPVLYLPNIAPVISSNGNGNKTNKKMRRYRSKSHIEPLFDEKQHDDDEHNYLHSGHPYRAYNYVATNDVQNNVDLLDTPVSLLDVSSLSNGSFISNVSSMSIESVPSTKPMSNMAVSAGKYVQATHAKHELVPTSSTPVQLQQPQGHSDINWQTYIGHVMFNKHERGHSLYGKFKKIGQGVFARVYKTFRKEFNNRPCALKVFPKKNVYAETSFANELMLLHNVSHPNIVRMYDAHVDPKYFYLEMEICKGGDIFAHICRYGRINELAVKNIVFKIVDAIRCFHEKDFVHRDLKPENIVFVRKKDITDIKLIDFGESLNVQSTTYYDEFVGTPCYFAPERFRKHSGAELKKSDVWAIGVIMFEMLTGCRCFQGGDDQSKLRTNIVNKAMHWPSDLIISSNARDFLDNLLEIEPLKRYSCHQALRHKWLFDMFAHSQSQQQYAPLLTSLEDVVNNPSAQPIPQSIVIRTSQSMSNMNNLKAVFEAQLESRKKAKKMQRKYKNLSVQTEQPQAQQTVPWKLQVTRNKSRSLEEADLSSICNSMAADEQQKVLNLPLPNAQKQSRQKPKIVKNRANTLGSGRGRITMSPGLSPIKVVPIQFSEDEEEEEEEEQKVAFPFHRLRHQKSSSVDCLSPAVPSLNVNVNGNSNGKRTNSVQSQPMNDDDYKSKTYTVNEDEPMD